MDKQLTMSDWYKVSGMSPTLVRKKPWQLKWKLFGWFPCHLYISLFNHKQSKIRKTGVSPSWPAQTRSGPSRPPASSGHGWPQDTSQHWGGCQAAKMGKDAAKYNLKAANLPSPTRPRGWSPPGPHWPSWEESWPWGAPPSCLDFPESRKKDKLKWIWWYGSSYTPWTAMAPQELSYLSKSKYKEAFS